MAEEPPPVAVGTPVAAVFILLQFDALLYLFDIVTSEGHPPNNTHICKNLDMSHLPKTPNYFFGIVKGCHLTNAALATEKGE